MPETAMSSWGMRNAWGCLVAGLVLSACSGKNDDRQDHRPIVRTEDLGNVAPKQAPAPTDEVAVAPVPEPAEPQPAAAPPTKPECIDQSTVISFDPAKLKACFDSNGDEQADRCVTWRRDGKVQTIDTVFAVEDTTAPEETKPPVEYRSDTENNDDERILLDSTAIDICPFDRACMKIKPDLGSIDDGGEIQHVLADPDFKRAVMVIRLAGGQKGTFELWDLASGHLRTRFPIKRLVADEYYDFTAHLGSGAVIALATNDSGRALGTVLGVDGSVRGELAQGSRNLDPDLSFTHAGTFGIVDVGAEDTKPFTLYLHSLATGAATGKFTIKRTEAGDTLELHTLKNGFVAATQWGEQVRIDMIDLKSRTDRVLFAPGC